MLRGAGGNDTLDSGDGINTGDYSDKSGVVSPVGGAAEDMVLNIENLRGGPGNDDLTGDGLAKVFWGGAGDDVLTGAAGNDTLRPDAGHDVIDGGDGDDLAD